MTFETKTELMEWQKKAVDKLLPLRVGALYMDMGTGKTRTALELIKRRADKGKIDRVLWLCPYSIRKNIIDDMNKHCTDDWKDLIRIAGIESLSSSQTLIQDLLEYVKDHNVMIVVDESSLVKNHLAIRSKVVENIAKQCKYRVILNGTPISKNEKDLFQQWKILDSRILGYNSFWSFAANHLEYDEKGRIRRCLHVDTLTEKISPYTYQVKREECLSLPQKQHYERCFCLDDDTEMYYQMQMEAYLMLIDDYRPDTLYKLFSAMQTITSGNLITSKPTEKMVTTPMYDNPEDNPRIQTLLDLIDDRIDDKCIIFCKYQQEVEDILKVLTNHGMTAVEFTGRLNIKQRNAAIDRFKDDAQFLIANKSCAAFGLNLQFCHLEIFYNNDWDYATRIQAEDRVHRLGQTEDVYIWDIYAENTIDERIINCLNRKSGLLEEFQDDVKKKQGTISLKDALRSLLCGSKDNGENISKPKRVRSSAGQTEIHF